MGFWEDFDEEAFMDGYDNGGDATFSNYDNDDDNDDDDDDDE